MNATTFRLWVGAVGLCMAGSAMADGTNVIPARYPLSRYEDTWKRASFALETPPQDAGNDLSFARDWVIVGVTSIRGVDAVLLSNRKNKDLIRLAKGEEVNGLKLLSVHHSPDPAQVKAVLQQGSETSQIGYDLSRLQPDPAPVNTPPADGGTVTIGNSVTTPAGSETSRNAYSSRMPGEVENVVMTDGTKPAQAPASKEGPRRHLILPDQVKRKPAVGPGAGPGVK